MVVHGHSVLKHIQKLLSQGKCVCVHQLTNIYNINYEEKYLFIYVHGALITINVTHHTHKPSVVRNSLILTVCRFCFFSYEVNNVPSQFALLVNGSHLAALIQ